MNTHPDETLLLGRLPTAAREAWHRAMAPDVTHDQLDERLGEAFDAVGYPRRTRVWDPPLLADDLTVEQRALVELTAFRDTLLLGGWPLPRSAWCRRRWLGLEPGGPLEALVDVGDGGRVPLWRAMRVATAEGEVFLSQRLPLAQRLEVLGDAALGAYGIDADWLPWGSIDDVHDEGRAWAPLFADRALREPPPGCRQPAPEVLSLRVRFPLFLSLVRSGIPIEARWDVFLPLATGPGELGGAADTSNRIREASRECIRAIPEARRAEAIVKACGGRVHLARDLVSEFPSTGLAAVLFANPKEIGSRAKLVALMKPLAAKDPAIAEMLAAFVKQPAPPKPLALTCTRVLTPRTAAELSAIHRQQLEAAGRAYDGQALGAEARLTRGEDEASFAGTLEIHELADGKGTPAYDRFTFLGDSGVVFRAGTTDVVGRIIQHNLQCDGNEALEEALNRYATKKTQKTTTRTTKSPTTVAKEPPKKPG